MLFKKRYSVNWKNFVMKKKINTFSFWQKMFFFSKPRKKFPATSFQASCASHFVSKGNS